MTSQYSIHADRWRDTEDVTITARVDRLEVDAGPFAALRLDIAGDAVTVVVTRPSNARTLARVLGDALADLDDWATDQPVPDPEPVSSAS